MRAQMPGRPDLTGDELSGSKDNDPGGKSKGSGAAA